MNLKLIFNKISNENITIELKNGLLINGILFKTDNKMNFFLKNVKIYTKTSTPSHQGSIYVRGNTIRYIFIPEWLNIDFLFTNIIN